MGRTLTKIPVVVLVWTTYYI